MIVGEPLTINGKEYIARFAVGNAILAEKKLGWSLFELKQRTNLTLEEMSILVRYGLHNTDGTLISENACKDMLDTLSIPELTNVFAVVMNTAAPPVKGDEDDEGEEDNSGKN